MGEARLRTIVLAAQARQPVKRWRKPLPPPKVAEGQVPAFTDDEVNPPGTTGTVLICRECFGRRVVGPIERTVDPRWVHAKCQDCGERVIASVVPIPQKENTEGGSTNTG